MTRVVLRSAPGEVQLHDIDELADEIEFEGHRWRLAPVLRWAPETGNTSFPVYARADTLEDPITKTLDVVLSTMERMRPAEDPDDPVGEIWQNAMDHVAMAQFDYRVCLEALRVRSERAEEREDSRG